MSSMYADSLFSHVTFTPEIPEDDPFVEALHARVLGPGRIARAASVIRERGPHERSLSFTARLCDRLIGSVRLTPILVGEASGHLLGPLAVLNERRKLGVGRHLVHLGVEAARAADSPFVLLVGDAPYYEPLGFRPVSTDTVLMPLPVTPGRLLVCELETGVVASLAGNVRHANCIGSI